MHCGAIQGDIRFLCIDCRERLGNPLSETEEKLEKSNNSKRLEEAYNHTDDLYVSKKHIILSSSCNYCYNYSFNIST